MVEGPRALLDLPATWLRRPGREFCCKVSCVKIDSIWKIGGCSSACTKEYSIGDSFIGIVILKSKESFGCSGSDGIISLGKNQEPLGSRIGYQIIGYGH